MQTRNQNPPAPALTPGQRVVRCLTGQPIDRVPFGVGLGWHPWGETHARWKAESGDPKLNIATALGYDASFISPALRSGPWPEFPRIILEDTSEYFIYRDPRGITAKQLKNTSAMPDWLDYPVKTRADWDKLKAERYVPGFDHLIPPDVSWDNFKYAASRLAEVCGKT